MLKLNKYMALSDKRILKAIKDKEIIIYPFSVENLATSSYDVTLGEYYYREQKPRRYEAEIFNIYSKQDMDHVWKASQYKKAKKASEVFKNFKFNFEGISPDDKVILLKPGETILAHTNEYIGGVSKTTTMMKARSSLGRSFIEVCKCAGWGDVGYVNRWTMEITNNSRNYSIPLVVGRRIAQIIFFETGEIEGVDYSQIANSKYSSSTDIKTLKKNWKPEDMLPKLYKDRDIKK
jgi:dCTP deaminase